MRGLLHLSLSVISQFEICLWTSCYFKAWLVNVAMGYHSLCYRPPLSRMFYFGYEDSKKKQAHENRNGKLEKTKIFFKKIGGTLPSFISNISICFFHDIVICEAVKNCSNHGTCAGPNLCTCERGFHGADCSEGK